MNRLKCFNAIHVLNNEVIVFHSTICTSSIFEFGISLLQSSFPQSNFFKVNQSYVHRNEFLGYDRHCRKFWYVDRRIIIEYEQSSEIWYYSSVQQFRDLIETSDGNLERELLSNIVQFQSNIEKQMAITESLTEEFKGTQNSYFEIEKTKKANKNPFQATNHVTKSKQKEHFYKLGEESHRIKTYIDPYTVNVYKPIGNKKYLNKFSLTFAPELPLKVLPRDVLCEALLALDRDMPDAFKHLHWTDLREMWIAAIRECHSPVNSATVLSIFQICIEKNAYVKAWSEVSSCAKLERLNRVEFQGNNEQDREMMKNTRENVCESKFIIGCGRQIQDATNKVKNVLGLVSNRLKS